MPYDANIITNVESPDFSDALVKGANMRSLMDQHQLQSLQIQQAKQQFNDQKSIRTAEDNNTSVDLDTGAITKDRKGIMSDLYNLSPALASKAQMQYAQQDRDQLSARMAAAHTQAQAIGELAGGVKDQETLNSAHAKAQAMGLDTSAYPTTFDSSTPQLMKSLQNSSLTVQEQLENQAKSRGQDIEQLKANADILSKQIEAKKLGLEIDKIYGTPIPKNLPNGKNSYQGPNMEDVDPATLISHVPESMKQDVTKEIGRNSRIADALPKLIQNLRNAGDKIKKGIYTPEALNEDLSNFHANLGPLVVEEQGAARQQAIDSLGVDFSPTNLQKYRSNIDDVINKKVEGLIQYGQNKMESSASSSTPIGDLKNYKKTRLDPDALMKIQAEHPQDSAAIKWAKNHPNDPRSNDILHRNGISNTVAR